MPELHFTVTTIRELPTPPAGRRIWYHDTTTPYLALRVFSTGKRVFYHYRWVDRRPQQTKLGDFPEMRIEQARKAVERLNGAIADGANPVAERAAAREEWTFEQLLTWYEVNHGQRKASGHRDRRYVELYFPELLTMQLSTITRTFVRQLHARRGAAPDDRMKKKPRTYAANRALAVVRSVFKRGGDDEVFEGTNPAQGIRFHAEESRTRRLQPEEIGRFLVAVGNAPELMRDYVLMSLMTGARRANVLAMAWADVDLARGEWRIPATKNGLPLVVPLEEQEIALLRERAERAIGPWVFPGRKDGRTGHLSNPKRGWANILTEAKLTDFRLHDLRRTLGSLMADSGASLQIIGKALGHKSQAATLVYARLSLDPIREAKRAALGALEGARRA